MSAIVYETIDHEVRFPIKVFMASVRYSCYHLHYDYELVLVLKGQITINTRTETISLKAGDVFLFNSSIAHEILQTNEQNICLFIQISQNLFMDSSGDVGLPFFYLSSAQEGKRPKNGYAHYRMLAARIGLEFHGATRNRYRSYSLIYGLIADFFECLVYDIRQRPTGLENAEDVDLLMNIINHIYQHHNQEDVLEQTYKTFGIGEKTLYRYCKRYIDISPKKMLLNYRINVSKEMLTHTAKSIPSIASECGFNAENTFYRNFKSSTGVTPNEFRSKNFSRENNSSSNAYTTFNQYEGIQLLENIVNKESTI